MENAGFYFDAESCIACHTCQIACKGAHNLPVGTNYRKVRSFCTGSGFTPRIYNVSLSLEGCDFCKELQKMGELPACVSSCPQRALEFGNVEELKKKHAGEPLADHCAAISNDEMANRNFVMRIKDCMMEEDYDEYLI